MGFFYMSLLKKKLAKHNDFIYKKKNHKKRYRTEFVNNFQERS